MCIGNSVGFEYSDKLSLSQIFGYTYGAFVLELTDESNVGITLGYTIDKQAINYKNSEICLQKLTNLWENKLEPVYSCNIKTKNIKTESLDFNGTF